MFSVIKAVAKGATNSAMARGLASKNVVKYPVQNIEKMLPTTLCIDEVSSGVAPIGDVKYTESLALLGDVPENS